MAPPGHQRQMSKKTRETYVNMACVIGQPTNLVRLTHLGSGDKVGDGYNVCYYLCSTGLVITNPGILHWLHQGLLPTVGMHRE